MCFIIVNINIRITHNKLGFFFTNEGKNANNILCAYTIIISLKLKTK